MLYKIIFDICLLLDFPDLKKIKKAPNMVDHTIILKLALNTIAAIFDANRHEQTRVKLKNNSFYLALVFLCFLWL